MKYELNCSFDGGGVAYILQSVAIHFKHTVDILEKAYHQKIPKGCPQQHVEGPKEILPRSDQFFCINPICDKQAGLGNKSTYDIITFMYEAYGYINNIYIGNNYVLTMTPYDMGKIFSTLMNQIKKGQIHALVGGQ